MHRVFMTLTTNNIQSQPKNQKVLLDWHYEYQKKSVKGNKYSCIEKIIIDHQSKEETGTIYFNK